MKTAPRENGDAAVPPKRAHFGLLLLSSFLLWSGAYVIDQTVRWTNHFEGFVNGVFHAIFIMSLVWAVYLGPWSALIWILSRWRGWHRYRTPWVLGPAVLAFVLQMGSLVMSPPDARTRFERFAGAELPDEIADLRVHFTGGGITDYGDTYHFTCTPQETGHLIRDMQLEKDPAFANAEAEPGSSFVIPLPGGWPDHREWDGRVQYRGGPPGWFFYLLTDESQTRVYIFIGSF